MAGRFWLNSLIFISLLAVAARCPAQGVDPGQDSFAFSQGGTLPAWVVPVLRLVSTTHVEPTTGVVVSDSGLVLVPFGFASPGDEIIVLDGGTDIVRNGRPARLERKFPAEGLAVLYVEGLSRRSAPFAADALEDGNPVQLNAFPPAEQIAQGEPPLKIPASVEVYKESGVPAVSGETPLPNVTGPLLDRCGNLAGVSIAFDIQSMTSSSSTTYQWREALLGILSQMQVSARKSNCPSEANEPEPIVETAPPESVAGQTDEDEPLIEPEEPLEDQPDPAMEESSEEEPLTEPEEIEELIEGQLPDLDILPPVETDNTIEPATEDAARTGAWPWLLAAAVLFGLGIVAHWMRKARRDEPAERSGDPGDVTDAAVEADDEDTGWISPVLDSRLVIMGSDRDGNAFESSCAVSKQAINVVIGRGDADIRIESAAVSRRHAKLSGTWEYLTISDLGSSNGTSINSVPCMEEEIMYVGAGDTIILGDTRFTIGIRPAAGNQAEE